MAGAGISISRRGLLIGGGVGIGLIVGWAAWPRSYAPNIVAAPGEHVLSAFVKIGGDGHVTVVVPQVEMGQGVTTALPQIVADELGADWRQIAVESAPPHPVYANTLFEAERLPGPVERLRGRAAMITGGSTSVRAFEARLRDAGAAARALLCQAAAARWDADWRACDTANGFVIRGNDRARFGEVAAEAAVATLPRDVTWRADRDDRLSGKPLPRLDLPAKIDGTTNYAADIRLPDMAFASIAQGPAGDARLISADTGAADRISGVLSVVETRGWVAAVATSWRAADKAVGAMRPRFASPGGRASSRGIERALDAALAAGGARVESVGDVDAAFANADLFTAEYRIGLAPHATVETPAATARMRDGRLELWIGTQAPGLAAEAAARAAGLAIDRVVVHPLMIGGSFGSRYETEIAGQAALLAVRLQRPVQLMWSRAETMRQDRFRPAAAARMTARLGPAGRIDAWRAVIAAPDGEAQRDARMFGGASADDSRSASGSRAVAGAMPPYAIPNAAIVHCPADIGLAVGDWRGRAHGAGAFFTECFVDELAFASGLDPFSFRMGMLGDQPRLALCLSKAAARGGWSGGPGSAQGLACHSMAGSHVAVFAEARPAAGGGVAVSRLVAVADCGRVINPDVVRAQIIGGLVFGMSAATGAPVTVARGLAGPERIGALRLPRMADTPQIEVELIISAADPGGVGEIAVPPVAPAIANALHAATGKRFRTLPLIAA